MWFGTNLGVKIYLMTTVRVIPVPFKPLKNRIGTSFVVKVVPLRGKNEFESHPQREILVPFRVPFKNVMWGPSPRPTLQTQVYVLQMLLILFGDHFQNSHDYHA